MRHEFLAEIEVGELDAREHAGGDSGKRDAGRLAHEGHGAARPRVHLDHVDRLVVHGELYVDEPAHAEREREVPREPAHGRHVHVAQQIGGQHARGVARMDPRLLDVLHDAADDDRLPVGHGVHVRLERILKEAVQQDRVFRRGLHGAGKVLPQRNGVVHDLHRAPAQHVARADEDRVSDLLGDAQRLVDACRGTARRHRHAQLAAQLVEPPPILRAVDRLHARPQNRHAQLLQLPRHVERRLSPELDDDALGLLLLDDREHILHRQRLEVELVGDVEVGGDRLRVRVHHDRLESLLAQRERGGDAAVVELDALPDAVRAAPEDDDLPPLRALGFVLLLVRRVQVRRRGGKLPGAGVDGLVHRREPRRLARPPHLGLRDPSQRREFRVAEARPLHASQVFRRHLLGVGERPPLAHEFLELGEEPRVDAGDAVDLVHGEARPEGAVELEGPLRRRGADRRPQRVELRVLQAVPVRVRRGQPPRPVVLQRAESLQPRLLEGAPDRHHLADRLHLHTQRRVGLRELLEREAGDLDDDVVEHGLEAGGRDLGDRVRDLVQAVADRELGPDARDGEAGRLRRQRRAARHPRVHLDDEHLARRRMHRELDVAAARVDPDLADAGDRRVAHRLVLAIREGEGRGDRDRVARVDAHGIEVLDRAHDDDVVRPVAHYLQLELLPADDAAVDEHLADRGRADPGADEILELLPIVGGAPARPAEGEGGTDDGGKAGVLDEFERLIQGAREAAGRQLESDALHRLGELLPVLGELDRAHVGPDQLHAVFVENAPLREFERDVERGLPAHRREERVRLFDLDHALHPIGREWLDVCGIGDVRVGHDRGGIRVHEDDSISLLAQRAAGLRPGVVELAGLSDHDRPGADEKNRGDVVAAWHRARNLSARSSPQQVAGGRRMKRSGRS